MSHDDECDVFHLLQQLQLLIGPTPIFGHFLLFFGALFGGSRFPQGGTKVKELNCYIFYCAMGTPKGVSQTLLGPTMCFHLFLVEWVTFFWVGWSTLINYGYIDLCIVC